MDKKIKSAKNIPARFRGWIQAAAVLLTNIHIPNLFKGKIYQGKAKTMCVPGLNCYSCPAATGACPIGAFQAVVGSSKFKFTYYITGLFTFKFTILVLFIVLSILFYRPFCKWICPLGAIYSLFNRVSFLKIQVDHKKCIGCRKCIRACKMDVKVTETPNHPECIRCGECMKACPVDAVCYHYGFSKKKQADDQQEKSNGKGDLKS